MEWVETTGKTIEEAKEAALDELGVAEDDAEFEVVEEPKAGLFGRVRGEARVRARVRPTTPRPKQERRDRKRRPVRARGGAPQEAGDATADDVADDGAEVEEAAGAGPSPSARAADDGDEASLDDQSEAVRTFLDGLVAAFGVEATTTTRVVEDDGAIEVAVTGDDLGLLIGPKGQTLTAVQDIARTVAQREAGGPRAARLRVDIGGYRERRKEALARFSLQVADQVKATGTAKALEPMSPPDRKVVHDTLNAVDGVTTSSQGEEPHRRVVITPTD